MASIAARWYDVAAGGANGGKLANKRYLPRLPIKIPCAAGSDSQQRDWHRWRLAKGADHAVGFIGNG